MKDVRVSKEDLLAELKRNREHHVGTFEQVLEDYKAEAVKQLEAHIGRIRSGAVEQVYVNLPAPQNYEQEYDRAIAMVEWEKDDTIVLTQREFNEYVLDQWAWMDVFNETAATYSQVGR